MARREEIKQQNLQKILTTAAKLFHEKGFEATTMNDLALRSGVSKVSIYRHFSSKDDIAIALTKHMLKKLQENYRERYFTQEFDKKSGVEQLTTVLMLFAQASEYDAVYYFLMMDYAAYVHRRAASNTEYIEKIKSINDDLNNATKPYFIAAIEKGRTDGTIRPGMDADELFFLISSSLRGVYQHFLMRNLLLDDENVKLLRKRLETLAQIFIDTLRTENQ